MEDTKKIVLYLSTMSADKAIKGQQARIKNVLDTKGLKYDIIDIASDVEHKNTMRRIAENETQLAPYITCDGKKCGDYETFSLAVDDGKLTEFLEGTYTP